LLSKCFNNIDEVGLVVAIFVATMPPKWRYSAAKKQLRKDILAYVATEEMNAATVYDMHNGLYHPYLYERFKPNLKNLHASIKKLRNAARQDEIAFGNVVQNWPRQELNHRTYPPWHNSQARALLSLDDIQSGSIEEDKPSIVWQSRPEYMEYPLTTFRDHLNKEKKKPTIKAYWEHQKQLKKEAKRKKKESHGCNTTLPHSIKLHQQAGGGL
jgi:hypothetical protein